MNVVHRFSRRALRSGAVASSLVLAVLGVAAVPSSGRTALHAAGHAASGLGRTVTPIKHVIVIIGENHTFDNV
ncbi:MAG: hypothetical protein JO206_06605, partial [Solirubrobacterales bacterium]|nr:hypothetical protein [Solirubrobacterales bacterium]